VRYLVISDIHANLHAFDAVMADASREDYDAILCLGDLVGYGADPGEVIDKVLALNPAGLIRGNHDKVCAGLEPAVLFNDVARQSVEWTMKVLTAEQSTALAELRKGPQLIGTAVEICHGAPFDEDHYVFDGGDAGRAIDAASARICLFGHTHLPAVYTTVGDPARTGEGLRDDELALPKAGPVLINVGSVGQPRDGDPRAAYGLLDLERNSMRLRRVTYDIPGAQKKIIKAGLPEWLAIRLAKGQ